MVSETFGTLLRRVRVRGGPERPQQISLKAGKRSPRIYVDRACIFMTRAILLSARRVTARLPRLMEFRNEVRRADEDLCKRAAEVTARARTVPSRE